MAKTPNIERSADLLLRAQLAALRGDGKGVLLEDVRDEWNKEAEDGGEVSKVTMRLVVRHLMKVASQEGFDRLGTLTRSDAPDERRRRGRRGRPWLVWTPARPIIRRQKVPSSPKIENLGLTQVFLGELACAPFEIAANGVFAGVFGSLESSLNADDQDRMTDLRARSYYYQPAVRRRLDADIVNECITAVLHRNVLQIDDYRTPNDPGVVKSYAFEPWTLVQSYDGLYVLGRREGATTEKKPFMLAVHRMQVARRLRERRFQVPEHHEPGDYLGHGFGPFVGKPGTTRLFVPDTEWNHVEEMEFSTEKARRQVDGGWEIELDTGFTHGLRLWCRWQGIDILEQRSHGDVTAKKRIG